MNIEQANAIPLAQILAIINVQSGKKVGKEIAYHSPWREEKTPNLFVNQDKNMWFDHGEGTGGDVISLVCRHLKASGEHNTAADALRWLRNMTCARAMLSPITRAPAHNPDPSLTLVKTSPIHHARLVGYLNTRGISLRVASLYLQEALLYNKASGKHIHALCLENENKGYELRNPFLKISLKKKGLSFVRGSRPKPPGIHLFEGIFDFLSALAFYKVDRLEDDAIILNSLAMLPTVAPLIQNYGYHVAYTWMDNDPAGQKATQTLDDFLSAEPGLRHETMNKLYRPYKDVSAWHMHKLGL